MPWYKRWFADPGYLDAYAHRNKTEAAVGVELFHHATRLQEGGLVLDLACGNGRHAVELARRGFSVVAADLSRELLRSAVKSQSADGPNPSFLCADMRLLPFQNCFEAVLQLFTAFGYFQTDEQNAEVLREVHKSLRPGGWYFLDFLNAKMTRETLVPVSETKLSNGYLRQERFIRGDRVEKRITIQRENNMQVFTESVRLFSRDELAALLEANGFGIVTIFGNYDGAVFLDSSPRCIFLSKAL